MRGRHRTPARPQSIVLDLSTTQLALGLGGLVVLSGYAVLIVAPAWASYGRLWERVAASFMTLFILATLLGVGAAIGGLIVWTYDNWH
jgi:hypothetical protein